MSYVCKPFHTANFPMLKVGLNREWPGLHSIGLAEPLSRADRNARCLEKGILKAIQDFWLAFPRLQNTILSQSPYPKDSWRAVNGLHILL